jgi:TRAP-type uncharacterized transport system substrate-binding protein
MNRRVFLGSALILWALVFGSGHTPYRQWKVYRKRYLLILTSKTDGPSYPLGKIVAEILANHLPASKARVTRAPHTKRIGSLLSSGQMDVALLSRADALAFKEGRGEFRGSGPVDLRTLFAIGGYLLICRDDFPKAHAYLVARTLDHNRDQLPTSDSRVPSRADNMVPVHPGALAYLRGQPAPGGINLGEGADEDHDESAPHTHSLMDKPAKPSR